MRVCISQKLSSLGFALLLAVSSLQAQESWSRFRGPMGNGVATGSVPEKWSESEGVAWKVQVPGKGHSSPVVADNKIWLTTGVTEQLSAEQKAERFSKIKDPNGLDLVGSLSQRLLGYDLETGKLLQDIEAFRSTKPEPVHLTNTYASPTPIIYQGRVYVHFGTYGTACIDANSGKVLWRFDSIKIDHQNGPGSSPIIWKDFLIVHFDGTDRQCIVALRLKDGSIAWQTDRSGQMDPKPDLQKAYCTPTIVETDAGPELISPAANWVYSYDPANGSELWKASYGRLGFSTVPCPVVTDGLALVCTSFMQSRLLAVRIGGRGDVTESHIAWTSDSNIPQKPSLAVVQGKVYVLSDAGIMTCLDSKSGKELWRHRVDGKYAASPIVAGNKIYLFNQEGKTTILRAGEEFFEVGTNQLEGSINASPAVVNGSLIIRTDSSLYRIVGTEGSLKRSSNN
ncbi:MAG: PQQ-binding-like beta-propeller repeat protein [Pirellulales bacterium]